MALQKSRFLLTCRAQLPIAYGTRTYASQALGRTSTSPATPRKRVGVINDDGRVGWGDLSAREKTARTTQQAINFSVIIAGAIMTGGIGYLLWDQVFSSDSRTAQMGRAFEEVKASARCRELLGPASQIRAYGEASRSRWTRNRPIAATVRKDADGRDHLYMHFNVEGPNGKGVVRAHLVRPTESSSYEYKLLALDVPGSVTIYLRNTDAPKPVRGGFKFLGVRWA